MPRRRRGAELEVALLEAAWDELIARGYDAFTIESVAGRARTSRAVLYRRWPDKPALVRAAIAHSGFRERVAPPDTGSLRGDLIALMHALNELRVPFAVLIMTRLGAFHTETGTSLADLRNEVLGERATVLDAVFGRAVERGEADAARLSPRVREVVFDLYRHEVLMTQRAVPDDTIDSIVDEVVVPLVRGEGSIG
jgi:AcrR family transcriptional regulator